VSIKCIRAHRQPAPSARYPPAIGPSTGPSTGPKANIAVAPPLCSSSNKSAITPPPTDNDAEAPKPARKRKAISASTLGANAAAMFQTKNRAMAISRTGLRPYTSLSGAAMRLPTWWLICRLSDYKLLLRKDLPRNQAETVKRQRCGMWCFRNAARGRQAG